MTLNDTLRSAAIGLVLGPGITASHVLTRHWTLVGAVLCLAAAFVTVRIFRRHPHSYAMLAIAAAAPFMFGTFGVTLGAVYLAGLTFVYGVVGVQQFRAMGVAKDNAR